MKKSSGKPKPPWMDKEGKKSGKDKKKGSKKK
jgi:hypothetical protein